jgi:hypothetical protein
MLEAMSCGAAIVGFRIRAFESMIGDGLQWRPFSRRRRAGPGGGDRSSWKDRDAFGSKAVKSITNRFDSRMLYSQLAENVQHAAGVSLGR